MVHFIRNQLNLLSPTHHYQLLMHGKLPPIQNKKTKNVKPFLSISQLYNLANIKRLSNCNYLTCSLTRLFFLCFPSVWNQFSLLILGIIFLVCLEISFLCVCVFFFSKQFWFRNQKVNILNKSFFFPPQYSLTILLSFSYPI